MEPRDIIVLTPAGDSDPSLAIAACRTGAMGVLDLEFCNDPIVAKAALSRLAQFAGTSFGVAIRTDAREISVNHPRWFAEAETRVARRRRSFVSRQFVKDLHASSIEVLFEAVSLTEATPRSRSRR